MSCRCFVKRFKQKIKEHRRVASLPDVLVGSGFAVISGRNRFPLFSERDHRAGIENAEPEEVVELEADPVHGPVEAALRVVERVPL